MTPSAPKPISKEIAKACRDNLNHIISNWDNLSPYWVKSRLNEIQSALYDIEVKDE